MPGTPAWSTLRKLSSVSRQRSTRRKWSSERQKKRRAANEREGRVGERVGAAAASRWRLWRLRPARTDRLPGWHAGGGVRGRGEVAQTRTIHVPCASFRKEAPRQLAHEPLGGQVRMEAD